MGFSHSAMRRMKLASKAWGAGWACGLMGEGGSGGGEAWPGDPQDRGVEQGGGEAGGDNREVGLRGDDKLGEAAHRVECSAEPECEAPEGGGGCLAREGEADDGEEQDEEGAAGVEDFQEGAEAGG